MKMTSTVLVFVVISVLCQHSLQVNGLCDANYQMSANGSVVEVANNLFTLVDGLTLQRYLLVSNGVAIVLILNYTNRHSFICQQRMVKPQPAHSTT